MGIVYSTLVLDVIDILCMYIQIVLLSRLILSRIICLGMESAAPQTQHL